MAALEKTVSALVNRQLPDFVRADHPKFKQFLELYYKWLEDESKGNTVYHIMRSGEYRDIDNTLDPFIRLFKQELLPYFPERSELDLVKILKGAREFYVKKGSEESVKWLFRVLFGQDIEVYYPKQQILIASDGKWKLPQAFQLTLSAANENIDVNLLERHKGTGSISKATCIIESANKTVDRTFGNEILEMYVSNVSKEFTNGENLEIPYVDENGVEQLFSEKIIGSISNIYIDSTIRTDPTQRRRGLSYNVGDPVVVFGGLADTAAANDAVAVVGNVTVGSVEGLSVLFPGYGYRTHINTETIVYRTERDDPNANANTDVRVVGVNTFDSPNSQLKFLEQISVDKMPIEYLMNEVISNTSYPIFTTNNRNMVVVISGEGSDTWLQDDIWYADSNGSYETANITGKILTANTGFTGASKQVILYSVANTPTSPVTLLVGANTITFVGAQKVVNVDSIVLSQIPANSSSQIKQTLTFETLDTGGVALYNIINGGYGFAGPPTVGTESYYDTYLSEATRDAIFGIGGSEDTVLDDSTYRQQRQPMWALGQIAHIWINNGGTGYANGDTITVTGRGYGFSGNVVVNSTGSIVSTNIINRGEGYYGNDRTVVVSTVGGANASLTAYGFGEGVRVSVANGAIGRIRDVRMISRGFDYIDTPLVSFKIVDMVVDGVDENENLSEGERVYQGLSLDTATFQGIVKTYNRSTRLLRMFNYSGGYREGTPLTSEGGVVFTVDTTSRVPAPNHIDANTRFSGFDNPMFYGNGKAKGYAEFFQGLIKFNGFYLNTDGFLSSDKKLQDANVYHNYSYVVESEKSLSEYENTMKDIVHPIGMSMLARTISRSDLDEDIKTESIMTYTGAQIGQINVLNSYANTVYGIGTTWTDTANVAVGDIIVLKDSDNELRGQAKIIKSIVNATAMHCESDWTYFGEGLITTEEGNTKVVVTGNTNPVNYFLQVDDELNFNIFPAYAFSFNPVFGTVDVTQDSVLVTGNTGTAFLTYIKPGHLVRIVHTANIAQTGTATIYDTNAKVIGSGTFFTNFGVGDELLIDGQVKSVVNVANDTVMNVNSAFTANSSEETIYAYNVQITDTRLVVNVASDTVFNVNTGWSWTSNGASLGRNLGAGTRKVTAINDNVITLNTSVSGTCTINYRIVPDYKTTNYDYEIIRVTE